MVLCFLAMASILCTALHRYNGGWNLAALTAMAFGIAPTLPGLLQSLGLLSGLPRIFSTLYGFSFFVGVVVSSVAYVALMPNLKQQNGPGKLAAVQ